MSGINNPGSGGSGGVSSLNGETGGVTLVGGSNVTITTTGSPPSSEITIASTGGTSRATASGLDIPLASPSVYDDDFNVAAPAPNPSLWYDIYLNAGYSTYYPTAMDVNKTFPDCLSVLLTNGNQRMELNQTYTPASSDFSFTGHISFNPVADFEGSYVYLLDTNHAAPAADTSAGIAGVTYAQNWYRLGCEYGGGTTTQYKLGISKCVAGTPTYWIVSTIFNPNSAGNYGGFGAFFHIQRVGGNWTTWWSPEGYDWQLIGTAQTNFFTVASVSIKSCNNGSASAGRRYSWNFFRQNWLFLPTGPFKTF